ncbi:hypothetical protein AKJ16_DCAP02191, partial [Drosera capensis]
MSPMGGMESLNGASRQISEHKRYDSSPAMDDRGNSDADPSNNLTNLARCSFANVVHFLVNSVLLCDKLLITVGDFGGETAVFIDLLLLSGGDEGLVMDELLDSDDDEDDE